ncbi:MAG: hydrophobe/amphiphile efflux-1 family RND transporter, partial [Verrucomicrobia bacterium]
VIAATALISAINAVTLKPTQCALWLRQADLTRRKNIFFRGFNAVYVRVENFYVRQIRRVVQRSVVMVVIGLFLIGLAGWGLTRIPTSFIPTEDQGYAMVAVQLPDSSSLERTESVMDKLTKICQEQPGVEHSIAIGGLSPLDGNASLANSGIVYLMFKDWSKRPKGQDLRSIYNGLSSRLANFQDAKTMVIVPPPIQGLGLSGGFQMQLQLTDGSFDLPRLQAVTEELISEAKSSPVIRMALTPLRASVPQISIDVNKTQAETLGVMIGDIYQTMQSYLGSSFVNLFTRFGHNYMVYAQADAPYRLEIDTLKNYHVRSQAGEMIPVGTVADIKSTQGAAVFPLYNLFPSATINGSANEVFSSGQALATMETLARKTLPVGMSYEWTAMSYQEKLAGNSTWFIFALALLLVYFVLAGQYESWITPAAVILAVPLALLGTVGALSALAVANNLYVQIGLVLLIALAAKNAILIVEMARECRAAGKSIADATVEACQTRFRPILMTSFTFILGMLPLVVASGAGASARKSLGLAVASGMLASTCLAVFFVPAFYVVLQRWVETKRAAKNRT